MRIALVDALAHARADVYPGLPRALERIGAACIDTRLTRPAPHAEALAPRALVRSVDLIVVPDASHALHLAAVRLCARVGRAAVVMSSERPPESLARELVERACRGPDRVDLDAIPRPIVRPSPPPPATGERRVLSCCLREGSSVGGVATWSARLGRALAGSGYDLHTLHIAPADTGDAGEAGDALIDRDDPRQHLLIFDPSADAHETLMLVRETIAAFEPGIILPNYSDLTWSSAVQLRRRGARTIAIAHTDDDYYRFQIGTYNRWDAGVAVSSRCAEWMTPLAGRRPLEWITYGVPIAPSPRPSAFASGARSTLRLAYIGRMTEVQKRVSRLVDLAEHLERLGVAFELDLIGDGPALEGLRAAFAARVRSPVRFTGAIPAAEVQRRLEDIDVSVLVSDHEGASISMLEAMGAGVIPCVTAVASGAADWVRDGENGLLSPVDDVGHMAGRLAWLAADRRRARDLSRRAWETVRHDLTLDRMASRYAELFDRVMASEPAPEPEPPTDLGVRLTDGWRWNKQVADDPEGARAFAAASLRESGFRRIERERRAPGCDAVVTTCAPPDGPSPSDIDAWRAEGIGVAVLPSFKASPELTRARARLDEALASGCRHIAIYGCGAQSQALAPLLEEGLFAAFIDDAPPGGPHAPHGGTFMGLPAVTLDEAVSGLGVDAVLLASERFEAHMWRRCEDARRRGARIIALPLFRSEDELAGAGAALATL